MNEPLHIEIDGATLADEVVRYLSVVELFRELDCEPTWRPERASLRAIAGTAPSLEQHAPTAH